jgi:WD40 repeat protein
VSNGYSMPSFSFDSRFMALGNGNGGQLWDLTKDRLVRTYSGLRSISTAIAISPDAKHLAAGAGGVLNVWAASGGQIESSFDLMLSTVTGIFFSADGLRLVYAGSKIGRQPTMIIRDARSGQIIKSFLGEVDALAVDVSADGRFIALGDVTGGTRIFDIDGRLIRVLAPNRSTRSAVHSVSFSPDSRLLASGESGGLVKIWDVASGKNLRTLSGHAPDWVNSLSWSPDGKWLATSDSKALRVWDSGSWTLVRSKSYAQMMFISHVKYMPGGHSIIVDGMLVDAQTLEVSGWYGQGIHTLNQIVRGTDPADNRVLIAGNERGSILQLDVGSGRPRNISGGSDGQNWWNVVGSKDGKRFVGIADSSSLIYADTQSGIVKALQAGLTDAYTAAISPDGSLAAVATKGWLTIINTESGQIVQRVKGDSSEYSADKIAFSPNNEFLASVWIGGALRFWRVSSGTSAAPVQLKNLSGYVAFSPDGSLLLAPGTAYDSYAIDVWSVAGPRLAARLSLSDADHMVSTIDVHPDQQLVAAGGFDGVVRIWNLRDGRVLQTLRGHTSPLSTVKFVARGTRLVSAAIDGFKIWDTATGQLLATVLLESDGSWLTITPEGFFDADSTKAAQNLSIVRGLEISSIDQVYNVLYRPDLVREKLAGDPTGKVKEAAAQLDIDKVMASGSAPKVAINSPAMGTTFPVDEVEVQAALTDQGGGIGKVEWRVNGVTLGIETRGFQRIDGSGDAPSGSGAVLTVKRKLALEQGENRIEVLAYNARNLIASEAAQLTVKWDGEKTATPPKLYVLAVGVNDYYDSRLRLAYAVPDATALAEGFRNAGTGLYAGVEVIKVLDADVTIANLDRVFSDLGGKVQPRDVFAFFLAGHGKTKNGRYYFLPRDFRYEDETSIEKEGMGQDKFQAWFAEIPARKSLLLYDTCESGSLTGNTRGSDIDERLGALNRMARATGRTFLTATTDDAPALEGYHGHGVFTYALLDALDHADVNKNGLIEVSELADYIDQKVPDFSFEAFKLRQIPQRSIVGNNFPLTNKTDVLGTGVAAGSDKPSVAAIPTRPTHVVVLPVDVKDGASNTATTIFHLAPGTQVYLVQTSGGWSLVARDGQKLGYVQSSAVAGLQ